MGFPVIEPGAQFKQNQDNQASWISKGSGGGSLSTGRIVLITLVVMAAIGVAGAKDIALIANKENHLDGMTTPELVKVCKGQTNHWSDGKPVTLVIRDPGSTEMRLVLQKLYEMPKEDVSALISSANHTRQSHPAIVIVDSDEALVKRVETTSGSVGLVDVYAITGGVTVVKVSGKLPLEPGYLLHGN